MRKFAIVGMEIVEGEVTEFRDTGKYKQYRIDGGPWTFPVYDTREEARKAVEEERRMITSRGGRR